MSDVTTSFLSELTGLPTETVSAAKGNPPTTTQNLLSEISGIPVNSLPTPNYRTGTRDPLADRRASIDLTNVYTDPISSYVDYGVPLNPFTDWNETRAQNQSPGEQFVHGLFKATITAAGAFAENTIGLVAGLGNMAFGNGSFYDNPVGRSIDSVNEWAQKELPNYYTHKQETDSILSNMVTMNFWADKVANGAGYTLGSIATMLIGTGEASLITKLGTMGGKGAGLLTAVEGANATKNMLYRTVKGIDAGEDLAKLSKTLQSQARVAKSFTAGRHAMLGTQMSLAEASVEARETKKRYIEEKKSEWESKAENYGKEMPSEVMDQITADAYSAGNIDFAINLPILATTNLIMFGKAMMGIEKATEKSMFKLTKQAAVEGEAKWLQSVPEGKIAKSFAKSARLLKPIAGNSLTESFQEAAQFAGSEFARNYVGTTDGMIESINKGLSKTFGTKEGLESIVIGAIVGGGSTAMSRLAGAQKKIAAGKEANTTKAMELINSGGIQKALENMEQTELNLSYQAAMINANNRGDYAVAEKYRARIISSMANRYNTLGAMDYFDEQLDDLQSMPEAEFIERFGYKKEVSLKEQTGKTQSELIEDVKSKAKLSIKRQDQVRAILQRYEPTTNLVDKMFGLDTNIDANTKKSMAAQLRRFGANVVLHHLSDIDSLDSSIGEAYKDMQKLGEGIPNLERVTGLVTEDMLFKIKTGELSIDDTGKLKIKYANDVEVADKKLEKEIQELSNAVETLNPIDKIAFEASFRNLKSLVGARTALNNNVAILTSSTQALEAFIENETNRIKEEDQLARDAEARSIIDNAESVEEMNTNFPEGASSELKAEARAKRERLLEEEDRQVEAFDLMDDTEFEAIDEEGLPPSLQNAYRRSLYKREDAKAEKALSKQITISEEEQEENRNKPGETNFIAELTDIEARTFGEVMLSADENYLEINGREYFFMQDNPLDAIVLDQEGNIIGIVLLDTATGNIVTFKKTDPNDPNFTPEAEKENAIVESLSYLILLKDNAIRYDRTVPVEQVKEENAIKAEAAIQDSVKILKIEDAVVVDENNVPESEEDRAMFSPKETIKLSDSQIRTQIEILKAEIAEVSNILELEWQLAKEAGFTRKEFDSDPLIKDLKKIRTRYTKALNSKIKILAGRKADKKVKTTLTPITKDLEQIEQVPTLTEAQHTVNTLTNEIENLEADIAKLEKEKSFYQERIDGKYGEAPTQEEADLVLKALNKKIGTIKAKVTKRKNLINKINEDIESEGRNQEGSNTEGVEGTVEEQDTPGADINPSTGIEGPIANGINQEEVQELRRKKAEAANSPVSTLPVTAPEGEEVIGPLVDLETPVVVNFTGVLDVQLVPLSSEMIREDGANKVLVNPDGTIRPNALIPTKNGAIIPIDSALVSDPFFLEYGSTVIFEVDTETDYWNVNKNTTPEDEHWKDVPIFVISVSPSGERRRIGLLQSYSATRTQRKGSAREEIYKLYLQGLTPMSTVKEKDVTSDNIANLRTKDGEIFFSPVSTIIGDENSFTVGLAFIGLDKKEDSGVKWKSVGLPGKELSAEDEENIATSNPIDINRQTPGQIAAVVRDPNGAYKVIHLSTRDMTDEAVNKVVELITANNPENISSVEDIVGFNIVRVTTASLDSDIISTEEEGKVAVHPENSRTFMMTSITQNLEVLYTFWSKEANSLIKISSAELSKALSGQTPKFSFVESTVEDGNVVFKNVRKEDTNYAAVEKIVGDEFKAALKTKKFEVNFDRLSANNPFTSPLTGLEYASYLDYLSSEREVLTPREFGAGSNAILATDSTLISAGSVFHNVGLSFDNISTVEKPVTTEENLEAKAIVNTIKPVTTPITPAAPISNLPAPVATQPVVSTPTTITVVANTASVPTDDAQDLSDLFGEEIETIQTSVTTSNVVEKVANPAAVSTDPLDKFARFAVPEGTTLADLEGYSGMDIDSMDPNIAADLGEEIKRQCGPVPK